MVASIDSNTDRKSIWSVFSHITTVFQKLRMSVNMRESEVCSLTCLYWRLLTFSTQKLDFTGIYCICRESNLTLFCSFLFAMKKETAKFLQPPFKSTWGERFILKRQMWGGVSLHYWVTPSCDTIDFFTFINVWMDTYEALFLETKLFRYLSASRFTPLWKLMPQSRILDSESL